MVYPTMLNALPARKEHADLVTEATCTEGGFSDTLKEVFAESEIHT